jgi:hypothetical protein
MIRNGTRREFNRREKCTDTLTRFLPVCVDVEMPGEIGVHFGFRKTDDF